MYSSPCAEIILYFGFRNTVINQMEYACNQGRFRMIKFGIFKLKVGRFMEHSQKLWINPGFMTYLTVIPDTFEVLMHLYNKDKIIIQ